MMYAAGFGGLAALSYTLPIPEQYRLVIPGLFSMTGAAFILLNLEERASDAYHYYRGIRKASSGEPIAQKLAGIKAISNNALFLEGGKIRTVLQVEPVNFALLEESQQKALILSYREFLNHLTTPIQIVVKTSRTNLDDYFEKAQARLQENNPEMSGIFEDFMAFEQNFLKTNNVRERRFYLVVCSQPATLMGSIAKKDSHELKELEEKTKIVQEKLLACGLTTRRLENEELKHFIATYSSQETESNEEANDENEKGQDSQTHSEKRGNTGPGA